MTRLTFCLINAKGLTRCENLVASLVLDLLVRVHRVVLRVVAETKVEVHAGSGVIGLRDATANQKILDAVLSALHRHHSLHVVAELFAFIPRNGCLERFRDDAIVESQVLWRETNTSNVL